MVTKCESSVFGIEVGASHVSEESVWNATRVHLFDQALGFPKDSLQVPQAASLLEISAFLSIQSNRREVREAVKDLTQADGAVVVYEEQQITFHRDINYKDQLTTELEVMGTNPSLNQLRVSTNVYRQTGECLTSGEALVRMMPLKPLAPEQPAERLGVFPPGMERAMGDILTAERNGNGQIKSPLLWVTAGRIMLFAEASGDFNDLHLNPKVAIRTPFKGRIAHGVHSISWLLEKLSRSADPAQCIGGEFRFIDPVRPWDIIGGEINTNGGKSNGKGLAFAIHRLTGQETPAAVPVITGSLRLSR